LNSEAKNEAEGRIQDAIEHAEKWQRWGEQNQRERDNNESRCKADLLEAERYRKEAEWKMEILKTEHDERIAALEELAEEERGATSETRQTCERTIALENGICEERLRLAQKKAKSDGDRAEDNKQRANERADVQVKYADEMLASARKECEARVKESRKWAEDRVAEVERSKKTEVDKMFSWAEERGQQMDETLRAAETRTHEKYLEATLRVDAADARSEGKRLTEELVASRHRDRLEEQRHTQLRNMASYSLHCDNMIKAAEEREKRAVSRVINQSVKAISVK